MWFHSTQGALGALDFKIQPFYDGHVKAKGA